MPLKADAWTYYCKTCDESYYAEDCTKIREDYGETLVYCPKCGPEGDLMTDIDMLREKENEAWWDQLDKDDDYINEVTK